MTWNAEFAILLPLGFFDTVEEQCVGESAQVRIDCFCPNGNVGCETVEICGGAHPDLRIVGAVARSIDKTDVVPPVPVEHVSDVPTCTISVYFRDSVHVCFRNVCISAVQFVFGAGLGFLSGSDVSCEWLCLGFSDGFLPIPISFPPSRRWEQSSSQDTACGFRTSSVLGCLVRREDACEPAVDWWQQSVCSHTSIPRKTSRLTGDLRVRVQL